MQESHNPFLVPSRTQPTEQEPTDVEPHYVTVEQDARNLAVANLVCGIVSLVIRASHRH